MIDPIGDLRFAVQEAFERLVSLVGLDVVEVPFGPPRQSLQVPVTSLDMDVTSGTLSPSLNANINRAFDEALAVIRDAEKRPAGARVVVSVSRKSYRYHIYATFEFYD